MYPEWVYPDSFPIDSVHTMVSANKDGVVDASSEIMDIGYGVMNGRIHDMALMKKSNVQY